MRKACLIIAAILLSGCGGGGNNNNNNPPPVVLLPSARYFPAPPGASYVYRPSGVIPDLPGLFEGDFAYVLEANPLGSGVYFNAQDSESFKRGPVFDGFSFAGMQDEDDTAATVQRIAVGSGSQADVLPAVINELGDTWPIDISLGRPADPFVEDSHVTGSATAAAVEDLTIGSTTFQDCLRVDASFTISLGSFSFPAMTASCWFAPDIGPIRAILREASVEVGRVQLVSASIP